MTGVGMQRRVVNAATEFSKILKTPAHSGHRRCRRDSVTAKSDAVPVRMIEATAGEERRYRKRSEAVAAVTRGAEVGDVARIHGVNVATLCRWLALYRNGGNDSLRERKRAGRPRRISERTMCRVFEMILNGTPIQHGAASELWTIETVRNLVKKQFAVEVSKSSARRMLMRLGMSPRRAIYMEYRRNPEALERHLRRTFAQIRTLARTRNAVIYFMDEKTMCAEFRQHATGRYVKHEGGAKDRDGHCGMKLVSAVGLRGDTKFRAFADGMNQDRLCVFLKALLHDTGRALVVIANMNGSESDGVAKMDALHSDERMTLFNLAGNLREMDAGK